MTALAGHTISICAANSEFIAFVGRVSMLHYIEGENPLPTSVNLLYICQIPPSPKYRDWNTPANRDSKDKCRLVRNQPAIKLLTSRFISLLKSSQKLRAGATMVVATLLTNLLNAHSTLHGHFDHCEVSGRVSGAPDCTRAERTCWSFNLPQLSQIRLAGCHC